MAPVSTGMLSHLILYLKALQQQREKAKGSPGARGSSNLTHTITSTCPEHWPSSAETALDGLFLAQLPHPGSEGPQT